MAQDKMRIDQLLVDRGLAGSRSLAQRLVMAGQVRVDGQMVHKSSAMVLPGADVEVESGPRYVSRAGEKLEAALRAFSIDPLHQVCADVGSSTGGFTDCLLQQGAEKVFAIDVGKGQLHWKLRRDPRVTVLEDTNARYLDELPDTVSLVTVDVSFISVRLILPNATRWLSADGELVVLIKPQFEAGPDQVGKGGIVKDATVHRSVVRTVLKQASELGLVAQSVIRSPILGAKGNQEFLAHLRRGERGAPVEELVKSVFT